MVTQQSLKSAARDESHEQFASGPLWLAQRLAYPDADMAEDPRLRGQRPGSTLSTRACSASFWPPPSFR